MLTNHRKQCKSLRLKEVLIK